MFKKFILKNMAVALALFAMVACQNEKSPSDDFNSFNWQNFSWTDMSIGNEYFDKTGIAISTQIDDCPTMFKCNIDLGLEHTKLQANVLKSLGYKFDNGSLVDSLNIKIDGYEMKLRVDVIDDLMGKDSSIFTMLGDTIMLGTLGYDFFADKFLMIDFPNNRISVLDSLPKQYSEQTHRTQMLSFYNRMVCPMIIDSAYCNIIFDWGSAMVDFLTVEAVWNQLIDTANTQLDYISVDAIGSSYKLYGGQSNKTICISQTPLRTSAHRIHYPVRPDFAQYLKMYNSVAIVGCRFFKDNILIADFAKHEMFVY